MMKACEDVEATETEKYSRLTMLAAATSSCNQVTSNSHGSTSQSKLLGRSCKELEQDENASVDNVSCTSKDVLPSEVAVDDAVDDLSIRVNGPSATECRDSTCLSQAITDHDGEEASDGEGTGSMAYIDSRSVDCSDELISGSQSVQSMAEDRVDAVCNVVSDRSNVCFDQSDHYYDQDSHTLGSVDHTDHRNDHRRQSPNSVDQTDHCDDHCGQSLSTIDHNDHHDDHSGQSLSSVDHTDHHNDHSGQSLSSVDHTDHCDDHSGQSLSFVDHTDHHDDDSGQSLSSVDHTDHLDDHSGQTLNSVDHSGQNLCHVDQVVMLTKKTASPATVVDHTAHSGQFLTQVDQLVMVTRKTAAPVTVVRPF